MSEQAGRELDAKVAERVMGAKHSNVGTAEWMHFPTTGPYADCDCERHIEAMRCPEYSTSITAAWEVLEKLRQTCCCIKVYSDHAYIYECTIVKDPDDDHDEPAIFTQAETAPLAICLAALKAVGAGKS